VNGEREPVAAMSIIVAAFLLLVVLGVLALMAFMDPIP
jgi:hypothetical protein